MSLKKLLVIHEENKSEDESGKCAYFEMKDHRPVLESDMTVFENFPNITIHKNWREKGSYSLDEKIIPDGANALLLVGCPKRGFYDYVKYCKVTDDYLKYIEDSEESSAVEKKKKNIWDILHFNLPSLYSLFTFSRE
ncbi:MAG: hypothetical protein WC511_00185 [Candidatus Pacearchaeota archaeon]